jgi:hypothetical protein
MTDSSTCLTNVRPLHWGFELMSYNHLRFSSNTDWKTKYYEVFDMLNETRADLEEFQVSSRELEEELNLELERTDKAQNELKQKVLQVEAEREEWKVRLIAMFNSTTVHSRIQTDQVYATSDHAQ